MATTNTEERDSINERREQLFPPVILSKVNWVWPAVDKNLK